MAENVNYLKVPVLMVEDTGKNDSLHGSMILTGPAKARSTRKLLMIGGFVVTVLAVITIILVIVLSSKHGVCEGCMAVASDNDVCTEMGANALAAGGGAVDATVTVLLCLGAVQPQSNGIGGGGFMLVHTRAEDKVVNMRETAPAAATQDMFIDNEDASTTGGLAVGVPGEIRGYEMAHTKYGRLPWKDLFAPSIKILREGITVTKHLEKSLSERKDVVILDANLKSIFFKDPSDVESYLRAGDKFTNPELGDTYETIANDGADAFYTGEIARNIIKAVKARGGNMEMSDLEGYSAKWMEPFNFEYRGKRISSSPPPASGHVVALTLQLLEKSDLGQLTRVQAWNRIIEAFRYGYAVRSKTGDPHFSTTTDALVERIHSHDLADELLREKYLTNWEGIVQPRMNIGDYQKPIYANFDGTHTTHVSVLGPDGEAVSCTSTVNLYFGSRVMTDDGILLNNEMDDFSTPGSTNSFGFAASPENFVAAGKSPMSSSSPAIVFDDEGNANFVTGAAGGSRIITGSLLSLINALDWDMKLKENVEVGRIHDQLNEQTFYESSVDKQLTAELSDLGYNMTLRNGYMSIVTSVSNLRGYAEAEGDPRKEGSSGRIVKPTN